MSPVLLLVAGAACVYYLHHLHLGRPAPAPAPSPRPAVDCGNWSAAVSWSLHPCGLPGSGTPGPLVTSRGEDGGQRRRMFETIYSKAVWYDQLPARAMFVIYVTN